MPDLEWWTARDVEAYLREHGSLMRASSFRRASAHGRAPAPGAYLSGARIVAPGTPGLGRADRPLWRPAVVIEWHAQRPGRGARTDLTRTETREGEQ